MTCPTCSRPARRMRRGICNACYQRLLRSGAPRRRRLPGDYVVAEWAWLSAYGLTRAQAARHLGMTKAAFEKALERHQHQQRAEAA